MPHSMIHGNACFVYFNKIWDIPTWGRQRRLRILVDDSGLCSVVTRHDAENLDTTERLNRLRVLEVSCIPIAEGRKRRQ